MKRKVLCLFLIVAMLLPLMPVTANATADRKFSLYIKIGTPSGAGTDSDI